MINKTASDNWITKRIMKLTPFERRFVNSSASAERTARSAAALLERVALPPEPLCLEVGCGQGAVTRLLVERYGAQVVTSDLDPAQVALAQERLADLGERVTFRLVDGRAMPFDEAQFDSVLAFQVMHHIVNGWRQMVAETGRVLRPGGWFVFTDVVVSPYINRPVRRLLPRLDQLEETALLASLAENGLYLEHYERGRGMLASLVGYCAAVARKV